MRPQGPTPRHSFATALVAVALLLAACASTGSATGSATGSSGGSSKQGEQPAELQGDPDTVAVANEILLPRAAALADVNHVSATCFRVENVAMTGAKLTSGGPLSLRRNPPSMLFRPSGTRNLQILETPTTRLVIDASRRHATRWTYERNTRCIAGVAALMLDVEFLANNFTVAAAGPFEDKEKLTQVTLVPMPSVGLTAIKRLELVFADGQDFPLGLRVIDNAGGFIDYEIQRPNMNPTWRDPSVHFKLVVPPGFKIAEREG